MKQYSLIIIALLLLFSCGGDKKINTENVAFNNILNSKNLDSIKAKKAELYAKQQQLTAQLNQLNDRIIFLDEDSNFALVTTITAKDTIFNHYVEVQGNVTTDDLVLINSEFSGMLQRIHVEEGQNVSKGQLLATIDDGGLGQQLKQMEIQAELAKTTFERQNRLWEQKIGSEIQFLQAKTNYESQVQSVKQMKQQLARTRVTAPFSGTIDEIIVDQGSIVSPGLPLMRIVNLNNMYIETDIPERYISDITINKPVEINFPVLGKTLSTKVRQTGSFINPANRTYKVQVGISEKDPRIKPNLTAKLKINDYTNPSAILIPLNIISEDSNGDQYVYAVKDVKDGIGTVHRVTIKTGKSQGDVVEVLEGLEENVQLIKEGARGVKDGQTVKVDNL